MINFSNFLKKNKPDMVVLLGDRYEVFSFCLASFFLNIPISHIHGGELTKSAFDDSLRHSITKLSDYHFVSHKNYRKRVDAAISSRVEKMKTMKESKQMNINILVNNPIAII